MLARMVAAFTYNLHGASAAILFMRTVKEFP